MGIRVVIDNGLDKEKGFLHCGGEELYLHPTSPIQRVHVYSGCLLVHEYLLIRDALSDVLQVGVDVLHVGEAKQNFSKVFFADGGHPFGVGQELNLQHLCLKVVHKPEKQRGQN